MAEWLYLASSSKASLQHTVSLALRHLFLWRSAFGANGQLIGNVKKLRAGDGITLAFREGGGIAAYFRAEVLPPLHPVAPGLVIDRLVGHAAAELIAAHYPESAPGEVQGLRLGELRETYFHLHGSYTGQTALRAFNPVDASRAGIESAIPPERLTSTPGRCPRTMLPTASARSRHGAAETDAGGAPDCSSLQWQVPRTSTSRVFDAYLMVDWSSAARPVTGKDSIWLAAGAWGEAGLSPDILENHSTRASATERIIFLARSWHAEGRRVLVALDFAFGYPHGFAAALGLPQRAPAWRELHAYFADGITDDGNNRHNRDAFAEACNQKVGAPGPGPFWGCHASAQTPLLTSQRLGYFTFPYPAAGGLDEFRRTDLRAQEFAVVQSVWKLNCGVSVGGQTLMGIKHLHALTTALAPHARVWPFETGWSVPEGPAIWFAELFPSLVNYSEWEADLRSARDRTQVLSCLRFAAEQEAGGTLAAFLEEPGGLGPSDTEAILGEEGWMLFLPPTGT
ncbi:hypothetical protein F0U59_46710 [Archangium gephyra]|nr:hypothetical protein F0U59_46710 [Archangium gephyra]